MDLWMEKGRCGSVFRLAFVAGGGKGQKGRKGPKEGRFPIPGDASPTRPPDRFPLNVPQFFSTSADGAGMDRQDPREVESD